VRSFSGIQPSGRKHLGNYLGAIRSWCIEQEDHDLMVGVVDLHALTAPRAPAELGVDTLRTAALLLACGLDPARSTIFVQSQVTGHAELAWLLGSLASVGELRRMAQFRAKATTREMASASLLTYPVLQAADILLYRAERVPVGEDQRQHLELARRLAERFNRRYGRLFPIPQAVVPARGARIMDLQHPANKMSSTEGTPAGTLSLLDTPAAIRRKLGRAVTDAGHEVRATPAKPGVSNLLEILSASSGQPREAHERRLAGAGYGALKAEVAEAVIALLEPIQARYAALAAAGFAEVRAILRAGAARARMLAEATMALVRAAVGLLPPDEIPMAEA
jgi:tryptophanyl-tRNA synthetase